MPRYVLSERFLHSKRKRAGLRSIPQAVMSGALMLSNLDFFADNFCLRLMTSEWKSEMAMGFFKRHCRGVNVVSCIFNWIYSYCMWIYCFTCMVEQTSKTVAGKTLNNVFCHSSVLVKITCARSIMTKNHPQSSIFMHLSPWCSSLWNVKFLVNPSENTKTACLGVANSMPFVMSSDRECRRRSKPPSFFFRCSSSSLRFRSCSSNFFSDFSLIEVGHGWMCIWSRY